MGYYIIESTDKKQIMNWADRIWDAGIHSFEVLIHIQNSAINFYNKAAYDAAKTIIAHEHK